MRLYLAHAPVLAVIIPLVAAALLAALTKVISEGISLAIALLAATTVLATDVVLLRQSQLDTIVYWFGGWQRFHGVLLGISLAVDPFGAGLAILAAVLLLAALVFSARYFDSAENHLHALLLVFLAALQGFVLTGDLFNLFVFFELMSAAAFALCAHKVEDPGSLQGALNFAVTNTIGAYFVITGLALLYAKTGALNMAELGRLLRGGPADGLVLVAFTFVVCGYLVKTAVVPFHFWLADAHAVAPTPVCILFSGVMVEIGLYAVARIYWTIFEPVMGSHVDGLRWLFLTLGALTTTVGAILCYCQRSLKRLLAFSTISHVGILVMGFGQFTALGLAGVAVYVIGHGLVKSSLFLTAGILLHRFTTVDEGELHGRGRATPWTGLTFLLGAVCLAGLPFSGLAEGERLMSASAESIGRTWISWISLFGGVVTSAAALRAGGRVFLGWGPAVKSDNAEQNQEEPETKSGHEETPAGMITPALVLIVAGLFLGLCPGFPEAAFRAAEGFVNSGAYASRVLEGVRMPSPQELPFTSAEHLRGVLAVAAAVLIAVVHLFSPRGRAVAHRFEPFVQGLRSLHSGHVGDYVTFLTCGVGVIGCSLFLLYLTH